MPRGSKPGERRGGRKPGIPNKATQDIKALAQEHGPAVFKELARLALAADTASARVAAAKEVLDRAYGRPSQPVNHAGADGTSPIQHAIRVIYVDTADEGHIPSEGVS